MVLTMLHHGHRLTLVCQRADSEFLGNLADPDAAMHAMSGHGAPTNKIGTSRRQRLKVDLATDGNPWCPASDTIELARTKLHPRCMSCSEPVGDMGAEE